MQESAPAFTPLPLRARNVLELLDTSLKVYKQYFWVIVGWSALINLFGLFASLFSGGLGTFLATPLFLGVIACCVAAAVRGQNVTFKQCWQFSQARFGGMLGWYLLATLLCGIAVVAMCFGAFIVGAGVMWLFSGASSVVQGVALTIYIVLVSIIISIVAVGLFTWAHIAPLVECMEENNREKKILPRSWDLMKGQWMRATTLMTILSLAYLVLFAIIMAAGVLIIGVDDVRHLFEGSITSNEIFAGLIMTLGGGLVILIFPPAMLIALMLFYLDLRVRKDALDLEWTAHTTAPMPSPATVAYATNSASPSVTGFDNLTPVQPVVQQLPPGIQPSVQQPLQPSAPVEATPSWQTLIEEPPPTNSPGTPGSATESAVGEIACPVCGKTSPANYLFCMGCGARLPGAF